MKTRKYNAFLLSVVTICIVAILIGFEYFIQVNSNRKQAYQTAGILADQVVSLIKNNNEKIRLHTESLKEDYITRAKAVAYIIDQNVKLSHSKEELRKIAQLIAVDEIHLFNVQGSIYAGTVPEYYGYNFDSGEQMAYFKPMLENKELEMCQDVTPNTAEAKLMMYAICWNDDGTRMIQVGIEPLRLLSELHENEITEVVATMPSYSGIDIIIADAATGLIEGSTITRHTGKTLAGIGIDVTGRNLEQGDEFSTEVDGNSVYCHVERYEDYMIAITNMKAAVNENVIRPLILTFLYIVAAVLIIFIIVRNMTTQIIEEQKLSNTDQMTGLYNRRAYEADLLEFSKKPLSENFIYISLDLNGLKSVNDNLGHDVGDRLIKGAAECMLQAFSKYGRIYRIGGDEFAALLFTDKPVADLVSGYRTINEGWSKVNDFDLEVSCGFVTSAEHAGMSIEELSKLADSEMYKDKEQYYLEHRIDRRRK
ncbi:MAG: GGDEF domain-containing protein [Lachnospiraceae bacterium]|nr:GGDEF domain-containing protein [Lachnospiraceae bacterium]